MGENKNKPAGPLIDYPEMVRNFGPETSSSVFLFYIFLKNVDKGLRFSPSSAELGNHDLEIIVSIFSKNFEREVFHISTFIGENFFFFFFENES